MMPFRFDSSIADAAGSAWLNRNSVASLSALREHTDLFQASQIQKFTEQWRIDEINRKALLGQLEFSSRFQEVGGILWTRNDFAGMHLITSSTIALAQEQARIAQSLALPAALEQFRTPVETFSTKLLALDALGVDRNARDLSAFNRISAISDLIDQSRWVGRDLFAITRDLSAFSLPGFNSLSDCRRFLDAAGLVLPRWPKLRLLSLAERRRRFKSRLQRNAEPLHVKRAKSLVHRYEMVLQEIIDAVMADAYGEEWAASRLPLCSCKDLLGRWQHRGGEILDHADYKHYKLIMTHPEHFNDVFEDGFDNADELGELIDAAGRLRAASHHPGPPNKFTPDDLKDLRITWRTLENGLMAFTENFEIEV